MVFEAMKINMENTNNGHPMLVDKPVEKIVVPQDLEEMNSNGCGEPLGDGIGSCLHVKQTDFSKNLCLEMDLALARQEQLVKMERKTFKQMMTH